MKGKVKPVKDIKHYYPMLQSQEYEYSKIGWDKDGEEILYLDKFQKWFYTDYFTFIRTTNDRKFSSSI